MMGVKVIFHSYETSISQGHSNKGMRRVGLGPISLLGFSLAVILKVSFI